jgi:hypothetical protein
MFMNQNDGQHKGNRGEAYLMYLGIMAEEDFNPNTLVPSLFFEQNFLEEELLDIADLVSDSKGAKIVMQHPNITNRVKAKLIMHTLEDLSLAETASDISKI